MKKLIVMLALVLALICSPARAFEPQEGDVIVWKSFYFNWQGVGNIPTIPVEWFHDTELFTHVDYVGADGRLYTSIQGQGSSTSSVESRLKDFYYGVVLRDPALDPLTIWAISESAYAEDVEYDDLKNWMIALDSLLWGNEIRFFGRFGFYPDRLACSTAVAKWFQDNSEWHSTRTAGDSSASDIFYWEGWEVAGTYNNF